MIPIFPPRLVTMFGPVAPHQTEDNLMPLPYATAPKDGRIIGLSAEGEGPFPMRWDPDATNWIIGPHVGLWITADGSMTWSDHDPKYAPTHWEELP